MDSEDIFELRHRASHPPLKKIFPRGKIHLSPISWNNRTKRSFNNGTPLSMTLPNPYSPSFLSNRSLVFTKTCSNFDFDFAWPILRRSRIFPADRETSCNSAWNIVTRFEKGGRGGGHTAVARGVSSFSSATRFDSRCREFESRRRIVCGVVKGGKEGRK